MLPSKPRSSTSDASSNKATPATPRANRLGRAASTKSDSPSPSPLQHSRSSVDRSKSDSPSPSPLQHSRSSVDRSPKSVDSKPSRSPKISTPPDKQPRPLKGSELPVQLGTIQEDLKKAREHLASVEQEKAQALEELKDAKKLADEANEKLKEALLAKKMAEESSEIEKFRADELEQASIEAAQKREEEWLKKLENVTNQHAEDVEALLSATQELQKVKHELAMVSDARNTALGHADDAMKIAEINAEKVEFLSGEVSRLKALLDSKMENMSKETAELVRKLDSEVDALKHELDSAKTAEVKLVDMEILVEGLKNEVTDAKRAETDAGKLVDEWKRKVELLEVQVEEASQSNKSSLDSLASVTKQLEENNGQLQDAESEIATLQGKVESLEIEVNMRQTDLEESDRRLDLAQQEALELEKTIEDLQFKLQTLEVEKLQALDNVKGAASNIDSLSEEKNKLINELEITRDEGKKTKKAMEGLTSALHEVSTEARETQERLLTKQAELEDACAQIKQLKAALKNTEERYEVILDEEKYEIVCLRNSIERYETEAKTSRAEWDAKEINFVSTVKKSEEELAALKSEMGKVVDSLKGIEHEAQAAKEDGLQMLTKLKQAESGAAAANEAAEKAKAESLQLKERLLDKENELQSITQENDDLRVREAAALQKVKELSALHAEATSKKTEENGELTSSKKEYDQLPRTVELQNENIEEGEAEIPNPQASLGKLEDCHKEDTEPKENGNGNLKEKEEPAEVETKMQESCKVVDKESVKEREREDESTEDDLDSKIDSSSLDLVNGPPSENMDNGAVSPTRSQQQKKKKPLLHKFGSLLKKKSNHK